MALRFSPKFLGEILGGKNISLWLLKLNMFDNETVQKWAVSFLWQNLFTLISL